MDSRGGFRKFSSLDDDPFDQLPVKEQPGITIQQAAADGAADCDCSVKPTGLAWAAWAALIVFVVQNSLGGMLVHTRKLIRRNHTAPRWQCSGRN